MATKRVVWVVSILAMLAAAGPAWATGTFSNVKVTISGADRSRVVHGKSYPVRVDWTYTWDTAADRPNGNATVSLFEQDPWFSDTITSGTYSVSNGASRGSYSGYINFNKPLATNDTVDGEEDWKCLSISANVIQPTAGSGKKVSPTVAVPAYVQPQDITGLNTPGFLNADGSVTVRWNNAPGARMYVVYRKIGTNGWYEVARVTKTAYQETPPSNANRFCYAVQAWNDVLGIGSQSVVSGSTVFGRPFAPASISYPNTATGNYVLGWATPEGATNYYLEEQKVGTSTWNRIADTKSTTVAIKYAGRPKGAQYLYRVQAYNPAGNRGTWTVGTHTLTIK